MKRYRTALVCLALLIAGLALRLPSLGSFLTPDEGLWGTRTAQFMAALSRGDWSATMITGHPGVTAMWAGSTGVVLRWAFARPDGATSVADVTAALAASPNDPAFLPWLRLPVVLACVLGVMLIYLLARRLLGEVPALLGAGLLAFDPFFLAHSRVLQMDALLATAVTIAWLALLNATASGRRRDYVLSGIAIACAVLTKSPALVMGPLMLGWVVWRTAREAHSPRRAAAAALRRLLWLGIPALVTFWLFWPVLWAAPLAALARLWGLMTAYSQTGHELGNFWLGQPVDDPGLPFYPAVVLWRTTLVTLPGLALSAWQLVRLIRNARRSGAGEGQAPRAELTAVAGLWLLVIWFTVAMTFGDKKFDRYVLPVFPAADLLAAVGWVASGRMLVAARRMPAGIPAGALRGAPRRRFRIASSLGAASLLLGLQALSALAARPDYLAAFNPLLGGIGTAQHVMLVGWGEGLAEAARWLNGRQPAGTGHVAAWYGQNVFGPFYEGQSYDLYYDVRKAADLYARDVDYVVTYASQLQRELVDPSVLDELGTPLFASNAGPVPLARVYRWPKPFAHTADQLMAPGLRLLGWDTGPASAGGELPLRLYWAADEPGVKDLPEVRAWLKDSAGEVWSTVQGRPGRTSGEGVAAWLNRPAAAQRLAMRLPAGLAAGDYRLEMSPLAGQALALGAVSVPSTRLAVSGGRDWQPVGQEVVYGDGVGLAGFALDRQGESLELDLVWSLRGWPTREYKYFVHVVGPGDAILAQSDGPLAAAPGRPAADFQPGDLLRQRVRLQLPAPGEGRSYRIYLGLYQVEDGARLPLLVMQKPVSDGRYLLTTLP